MRTWVLVLLLGASACVREEQLVDRFVEKYCEARWKCGCESPGLTQVHCESMLTREGEEAQTAAHEAGLEYDRECAKAWLRAVDDSCGVQVVSHHATRECEPCAPYHGNRREGETCERFGPWSNCARELRCGLGERCEDPCEGEHVGDHCDFDVIGQCGNGLVCSWDACTPAPALGEPCETYCQVGAACDFDEAVCVEAPGFGEPCGDLDACGRNLRCAGDVCDVGNATVCVLGSPW
jgi:hypothetical protein